MSLSLHDIEDLLMRRGAAQYGKEAVSQLDHALQCAALAEASGETPETVVACLLHDLGHLLAAERDGVSDHDTREDDLHQFLVLPFIRDVLPDAVVEPIRLHVDAKRYLCFAEPGYFDTLSPASVASLAQQGGVFSEMQADEFIRRPFATESVRLRRYDDLAKIQGKQVPDLTHFMAIVADIMAERLTTAVR